jgi:hypothetical protein
MNRNVPKNRTCCCAFACEQAISAAKHANAKNLVMISPVPCGSGNLQWRLHLSQAAARQVQQK